MTDASGSVARSLAALAEGLSQGVMLLDAQARLLWANDAARALLERADDLTTSGNTLVAARVGNCGMIASAVRSTLAAQCESWLALEQDSGRPLVLRLRPLDVAPPVLAAFVTDANALPAPPAEALETIWRLTPAEARVAALLASGQRVELIASHLGVQANTCRRHLKAAFAKTGTASQAELVSLVCGVTAPPLMARAV